jgi:hypothetical protein
MTGHMPRSRSCRVGVALPRHDGDLGVEYGSHVDRLRRSICEERDVFQLVRLEDESDI